MRTLAFDGRMGASGDMVLGALVAAGADPGVLDPVEEALDVEYRVGESVKNGIAATDVDVVIPSDRDGDGSPSREEDNRNDADHDPDHHDHDHNPDHDHGHGEDDHAHGHGGDDDHAHGEHEHAHAGHIHAEGHGPYREYTEVVEIVEDMELDTDVEADAKAIFEILGEAEASVHGTDLTETHFHEVGADDAIADVVGACLLLDDLDPDRVVTTPLSTGGGEVAMSHGTYPVPTPAVVDIAERADWELRGGPVAAELLTPTGAAILAHLAEGVDALPSLRIEASGYGAGGWDFPEYPNVLRAIVGDSSGGLRQEEITVLETNLDDATPEVLGGLQESLSDVGALDVTIVPTTMKKSRPGHLVSVVAKPEDAERVAERLARETGTLGVREAGASHRWVADREIQAVTLEIDGEPYDVDVKVASAGGEVYDVSAEFDDALAASRETDLPVREVIRRAEALVRDR